MKVIAYKCPYTGELFEHKTDYESHARRLRTERRKAREEKAIKDGWASWIAKEKLKITHVDMIVPWFMENQRLLMEKYNAVNSGSWYRKFSLEHNDSMEIVLHNLKYEILSNTHECPDGGITNWSREKDKPLGYPGFRGSISGRVRRDPTNKGSFPDTELLKFVGLKTCGGGGSIDAWKYGVSIFIDDWPGLNVQLYEEEQERIVNRLKGVR